MGLFGARDTKGEWNVFTPWSLVHFLAGVFLTSVLLLVSSNEKAVFWIAFALHVLYELFDILGTYTEWFKDFHDSVYDLFGIDRDLDYLWTNSIVNSVGDQASFVLGELLVLRFLRNRLKSAAVLSALAIFACFQSGPFMTFD